MGYIIDQTGGIIIRVQLNERLIQNVHLILIEKSSHKFMYKAKLKTQWIHYKYDNKIHNNIIVHNTQNKYEQMNDKKGACADLKKAQLLGLYTDNINTYCD